MLLGRYKNLKVEGITCYLSGDYAASASNGGKTRQEAGPKCCSAEESAEQTATILILLILIPLLLLLPFSLKTLSEIIEKYWVMIQSSCSNQIQIGTKLLEDSM